MEGTMPMKCGQRAQQAGWFTMCMASLILLIIPAFVFWAPWTASVPAAQAAQRYPGQIDPRWRAVTVNHGHPQEWPWGTIAQNPAGYAVCSIILALGLAGF